MRLMTILALLSIAAPCRADNLAEIFGALTYTEPCDVVDVAGYQLPDGFDYTHVLVGHARHLDPALVAMHCDRLHCVGPEIQLPRGEIGIAGIVDLMGAPGPIAGCSAPDRHTGFAPLAAATGMRWPALVVCVTEHRQGTEFSLAQQRDITGDELHQTLVIVSLARPDERDLVVFKASLADRYSTGVGLTATFRFARGEANGPLELVSSEQRHNDSASWCSDPKPIEHRYVVAGRRYEQRDSLQQTGHC